MYHLPPLEPSLFMFMEAQGLIFRNLSRAPLFVSMKSSIHFSPFPFFSTR
jgi:hypothetical protein